MEIVTELEGGERERVMGRIERLGEYKREGERGEREREKWSWRG